MTTKKYASKKEHKYMTQHDKVSASGAKLRKRADKHRLDGSTPGGVVSEYFRAKNSRVII